METRIYTYTHVDAHQCLYCTVVDNDLIKVVIKQLVDFGKGSLEKKTKKQGYRLTIVCLYQLYGSGY